MGNCESFDGSAQISRQFFNKDSLDLSNISFHPNKNGKVMQSGNSKK